MDESFKNCDRDAVVELHAQIKHSILDCNRTCIEYERILRETFETQDLLENLQSKDYKIHSSLRR